MLFKNALALAIESSRPFAMRQGSLSEVPAPWIQRGALLRVDRPCSWCGTLC